MSYVGENYNNINYEVNERKYAIRFLFKNRTDAENFKLPPQYRIRFELTKSLDEDINNHKKIYIRVAQIKIK